MQKTKWPRNRRRSAAEETAARCFMGPGPHDPVRIRSLAHLNLPVSTTGAAARRLANMTEKSRSPRFAGLGAGTPPVAAFARRGRQRLLAGFGHRTPGAHAVDLLMNAGLPIRSQALRQCGVERTDRPPNSPTNCRCSQCREEPMAIADEPEMAPGRRGTSAPVTGTANNFRP
jgi:hypothetical protein